MAILLANIGNTNTELAIWENGRLRARESHRTAGLLARQLPPLLARNRNTHVLAACVVPDMKKVFEERHMLAVHWLGIDPRLGVGFDRVDAATLGADRIANCIAATELCELPAIVIDCGTAITLEVVDRASSFRGGAILAGRKLARKALSEGTGLLPIADMVKYAPAAIGTTTVAALQSGIDLGTIGAVERIVTQMQEELSEAATVIAVGGDREYFVNHLEGVILGPDDFTLQGLAFAAKRLGVHA